MANAGTVYNAYIQDLTDYRETPKAHQSRPCIWGSDCRHQRALNVSAYEAFSHRIDNLSLTHIRIIDGAWDALRINDTGH